MQSRLPTYREVEETIVVKKGDIELVTPPTFDLVPKDAEMAKRWAELEVEVRASRKWKRYLPKDKQYLAVHFGECNARSVRDLHYSHFFGLDQRLKLGPPSDFIGQTLTCGRCGMSEKVEDRVRYGANPNLHKTEEALERTRYYSGGEAVTSIYGRGDLWKHLDMPDPDMVGKEMYLYYPPTTEWPTTTGFF